MNSTYHIFPTFLLLCVLLVCCTPSRDSRLTDIAAIVSDQPSEALDRLNRICPDSLSTSDRHYLDFLTIKAKDKAYIRHTSDSLIRSVMEYVSSHKNEGYYPEALYYAGRVYNDLGDLPTALRYYQEALDQLPSEAEGSDLKIRIMSNTGRLLNTLHLPEEAIPYLVSVTNFEQEHKDTLGKILDLQLLGHTYMRAGDFITAKTVLHEANELENRFSKDVGVVTKNYLAWATYKAGDLDSALMVIRGVPEIADSLDLNNSLCYASGIYLEAGLLDSAYMYADRLIHSADYHHIKEGYQIILDPRLRPLLPSDSIDTYLENYASIIKSSNDSNSTQLAINQHALYNYELHEREKIMAEKTGNRSKALMRIFIMITVIAVAYIFYQKFRDRDKKKTLPKESDDVRQQQNQMMNENVNTVEEPDKTAKSEEEFNREGLIKDLIAAASEDNDKFDIHPSILQSETYIKLQDMILQGKSLKSVDPFWKELEERVGSLYPDFRKKLTLLSSGKMTAYDFHLALLIKCGIRPSDIATILCQTNGAFTSKRTTLSKKLFDTRLSANTFTNIIRML